MKKKYYKEKIGLDRWVGTKVDSHGIVKGSLILLNGYGVQSYNNSLRYHGVEITE